MNLVQIRNSDKYNFHNEEVKDVFRITSAIYDERYDVIYKDYKDKNISLEVLNIISVITETAEVLEIVENTSSEKGINMCEALKKLQDESKKEERINSIMSMLDFGVTKEQILTRYSEEEYNMARKNLIKNK